MTSYDTIILGSSPNALTAAAYLARGGKKVLVLEPSSHLGGAVSTTEFAKGFQGDQSLTSGRIDAEIIKDLKLYDHGLEVIERKTITSLLADGLSFTLPIDCDAACEVIRGFAPKDADRYKPFMQLVDLAADFLNSSNSITPPKNHPPSAHDVQQFSQLVSRLRGYGNREMTEVVRLLVMSIRDLMDEWFESPELKGLLATVAVRGLNQGPFAGSTTYNLLHHFALGDGLFRATAKGGIGAISQALSKAAIALGAEVRTAVSPLQVVLKNGTATGVRAGGETIDASTVISDFDALHTFSKLVPPPELEPEFNRALRHTRYNGAVARINLALSALPEIKGLDKEALSGTLVIAPSLAYLERAFDGGKYGGIAEHPFIEVTLPSVTDPTLAPQGKHVMSAWVQYAPYRNNIDSTRLLDLSLEQLIKFIPNLKSLVLHSQVTTPAEFETRFNLSEGHLYGGEMSLAQSFFLRPIPGFADYHTPISGLYLCGAATHPGGVANGISGRNVARELGVLDLVLAKTP